MLRSRFPHRYSEFGELTWGQTLEEESDRLCLGFFQCAQLRSLFRTISPIPTLFMLQVGQRGPAKGAAATTF